MADIEPPSFSLGLDLDFEPPQYQQNEDDEELFQMRVSDSDSDSPKNQGPTRLRRLRRGGPHICTPKVRTPPLVTPNFADDDIEDFSSEENIRTDDLPAPQHHSLCSSSKVPLSGIGVLTRPPESTILNKKRKQDSKCPPSTSIDSNKGKLVFPDLTTSPLRRFRLLDSESDSDYLSEGMHIDKAAIGDDFLKTSKQKESNHGRWKIGCEKKIDSSASILQKDLWEDFYVENNCSIPTPVFDELCEEYCKAGKQGQAAPAFHEFGSNGQGTTINNAENIVQNQDLGSVVVPCHRYFFHDDLRIQRLVRSRLPYFCPLSSSGDTGNKPYNASSIDYMRQFGSADSVKQNTGRRVNVEKSSKRAGRKNKKANLQDQSNASQNWINTKQTTNTPKDAGKRRVRAEGQSAGQWLTAENGMKVYVTKSGKELSGRLAYMHYKKETGGFRQSKKKRSKKK